MRAIADLEGRVTNTTALIDSIAPIALIDSLHSSDDHNRPINPSKSPSNPGNHDSLLFVKILFKVLFLKI